MPIESSKVTVLREADSVLRLAHELSPLWFVEVRGGTVAGLDEFYSKRFDSLR